MRWFDQHLVPDFLNTNPDGSPIPYWDIDQDYASAFLASLVGDRVRAAHPTLAEWSKTTRLNPASGVSAYRDDPRIVDARERLKRFGAAAVANLQQLLAPRTLGV